MDDEVVEISCSVLSEVMRLAQQVGNTLKTVALIPCSSKKQGGAWK